MRVLLEFPEGFSFIVQTPETHVAFIVATGFRENVKGTPKACLEITFANLQKLIRWVIVIVPNKTVDSPKFPSYLYSKRHLVPSPC